MPAPMNEPMKITEPLNPNERPYDGGAGTLLRTGFWVFLVGALAGLAIPTFLGGIGIYGARSSSGWIALIICMMNCPFGLMLLLLGGAKWMRNRRKAR